MNATRTLKVAAIGICVLGGLVAGRGQAGWLLLALVAGLIFTATFLNPQLGLWVAVVLIPLESVGRIIPGASELTLAKVAMVACVLAVVAQALFRSEGLTPPPRSGLLYVVAAAAVMGSALHWANGTAMGLVALLGQLVIVLLVHHLVRDQQQYRHLVMAIVVGSIPIVVVGIMESILHVSMFGTVTAQQYADQYLGLRRITATFYDPNAFGRYLLFVLALTLGSLRGIGFRPAKMGLVLLAAMQVYCIAFTFSRGTVLATVGVGIVLLLWDNRMRSRAAALLGGAVALGAAFVMTAPIWDTLVARFSESGSVLGAGASRLSIWALAVEAVEGSPLVGYGPGGVAGALLGADGVGYSAHNLVIESLLVVGIVGTSAFAVFAWAQLVPCLRARRFACAGECGAHLRHLPLFC